MLAGGLAGTARMVQLVMPALNADAFAVNQGIGHLAARAVQNALQGATGNHHLLGGLILIKPL